MSRKRFLIASACCCKADKVARRDALACSSACRAWLRRHPDHVATLIIQICLMFRPSTLGRFFGYRFAFCRR
jgi:hypothetical protein